MLAAGCRRYAVQLFASFRSAHTSTGGSSSRKRNSAFSAGPAKRKMQHPSSATAERKTFTIAVEGCCHGELDNIYATLAHLERVEGRKVDLLICCGDFQAVRNLDDLETMSVPVKYRDIMTFYKYYSGEKVAPVPTLFIGGNHEASNYLWELHYGGWAAPNIYFLGYAGAVRFGGHRIAGLSGTYVAQHYQLGHHEKLPYDDRTVKSAYHVRQLHVHRLMQLQQPTSVLLSHDWPNLITGYGNSSWLFNKKPYFKNEALRGDLGSPANQQLLEALKPDYYFAAHLHVKFPAVVRHSQPQLQQAVTAGKLEVAAAGAAGGAAAAAAADTAERVTRFLALDKCLPGRDFLQVIDLDVQGPLQLCYDPEWLAILRSTHDLMSTNRTAPPVPADWGGRKGPQPDDVAFVHKLFEQRGTTAIPNNFVPTAPPYDPSAGRSRGNMPRQDLRNPQTVTLLEMLQLRYNLDHAANSSAAGSSWLNRPGAAARGGGAVYQAPQQQKRNPEEIDLDSDSDTERQPIAVAASVAAADVLEIPLDDIVSDEATAAETEGDGKELGVGGAMADGAPESDTEPEQQQQQADPDDPMFGRINTGDFPYYTS